MDEIISRACPFLPEPDGARAPAEMTTRGGAGCYDMSVVHEGSVSDSSDAELVERALSGSRDAFGKLVERYEGMIRGIIRRSGARTDGDEDDLAQKTLLTAHRRLSKLQNPARFDSWLWGITARICAKHASRHHLPFHSIEEVPEPVAQSCGLTPVERFEIRERIAEALLDLPESYQSVVVLRYLDQLGHREIAQSLDLTAGQVRSYLYRGTQRLRARLRSIWNLLYPDDKPELLPEEVREILEHQSGAVVVISEDLEILAVNRPFRCDTGFTDEEVVGRHCYEVQHARLTPCKPDHCPLTAIRTSGREVRVRHRHRHKDGRWHETDTVAFPVVERIEGGGERRFFVQLSVAIGEGAGAE